MNQVRQTTVHGIRGLRLQTRAIGHAALSAGDRSHQHGVPPYILVTWVSGLVMPMLLETIYTHVHTMSHAEQSVTHVIFRL